MELEFIEVLEERPEKPKYKKDTPATRIAKEIESTDAKYLRIDFKKVENHYTTPQSLARVLGRLLPNAEVFADGDYIYVIRE